MSGFGRLQPGRAAFSALLPRAEPGPQAHPPPLTTRTMQAGHGFHFTVPDRLGPAYLDVMARPPRVGSFVAARRRAQVMATDWGRVPVVGIEDLVLLKLTRRFSDYEVVSNLVRSRISAEARPSVRLLRWAARFSFRAEDRSAYLARLGMARPVEQCRTQIAVDVARLQARDVRYWRPHLAELRRLRRTGGLLPEGIPVAALLRS